MDVLADGLDAGPRHQIEAAAERGNVEEVCCPVLERFMRRAKLVSIALHRYELNGAAGKPRPRQPLERPAPGEQRPDAGGITEHLVERDRDEVGWAAAQAQRMRRNE